jgi:hypothetical protein
VKSYERFDDWIADTVWRAGLLPIPNFMREAFDAGRDPYSMKREIHEYLVGVDTDVRIEQQEKAEAAIKEFHEKVPTLAEAYAQEEAVSQVAPAEDRVRQLQRLILGMSQLELRKLELEQELETVGKEYRTYADNLVPEMMAELGMKQVTTAGGAIVTVSEEVRASFPKEPQRQATAFQWLKDTGNDGLIRREIKVSYGRDSTEWAELLVQKMEEWGVAQHGVIDQKWSINHRSMLAFIRSALRDGTAVPLEAFGAVVQKTAKIKRSV